MIPVTIQTVVFSSMQQPAIIVLRPDEPAHDNKTRIVPIWVGAIEATQLSVAIEQAHFSRPMTHDLFLDALTNLDCCVDHVYINDFKGTTFYAKLTLRQGGRLIELDARPSDALALAVRQGAPIYMEENLLEKCSYPFIFKGPLSKKEEMDEFHDFLSTISPEDFLG